MGQRKGDSEYTCANWPVHGQNYCHNKSMKMEVAISRSEDSGLSVARIAESQGEGRLNKANGNISGRNVKDRINDEVSPEKHKR